MPTQVVNYDGSITAHPQQLVFPESVETIQTVLRDPGQYPSPVRAMGSYHSLTPCASSDGTMLNMSKMSSILSIHLTSMTMTAQAGVQIIQASQALREQGLQFMLNIEIGNMTLGAAACCHSKDALDGIEFGQVSSYVIAMKWVAPDGSLREASEKQTIPNCCASCVQAMVCAASSTKSPSGSSPSKPSTSRITLIPSTISPRNSSITISTHPKA